MNGTRIKAHRLVGLRHRLSASTPAWGDESGIRVVITGSGGVVGSVACAGLADDYTLRRVDREPGVSVDVVADLRSPARVRRVLDGADAVIHLAANGRVDANWKTVGTDDVAPALNVFEAAADLGVQRVVFASSNHVVGACEHDEPYASIIAGELEGLDPGSLRRISVDDPVRADGPYGAGKAYCEVAGRYYAESGGPSVVCLRIGTVRTQDRPGNIRHLATLLTHRDLVSLLRCSLRAPESLRYGAFFGVSNNTWRFWDIESARQSLGYAPVDDAESWREQLGA